MIHRKYSFARLSASFLLSSFFCLNTFAETEPNRDDEQAQIAETPQAGKATITKVNIRIHPIFDESNPKENNFLFRLANRLHVDTDVDVIKNDLLFSEGSAYREDILYESERILRSRRYLNKVKVTPGEQTEEGLEVNVDANEVWTLVPTLGFSRSGGDNDYSVGFKDSNFLGYGKSFDVSYNRSDDRTGQLFQYNDPNTGWHQTQLSLAYEDNSDGSREFFSFKRPYFSLTTPNAGSISFEEYDREESYYDEGDKVDSYQHISKTSGFYFGTKLAKGDERHIHRFNLGYLEQDDKFSTLASEPNIIAPPQDRLFKIAWAEYQYIQNQFSRNKNIRQINTVEDINFGLSARLRAGHVHSPMDRYDESASAEGGLSRGFMLGDKQLVLVGSSFSGFYGNDEIYNGVVRAKLNYHWQNTENGQFYIGLSGARGLRLFEDRSLAMGGEAGLRAYPDNFQFGDKRYLVNLEQRFYSQREWLSLFYMGLVIFYDEGRAWGNSVSSQNRDEVLRDVGFGLRFSGTRNGSRQEGSRNVLHLDIAHPLDRELSDGDELSEIEVSVRVRKSF